jgi:hypothetical protein
MQRKAIRLTRTPAGSRRSAAGAPADRMRIRFIGAEGNYNSVTAHGHRISAGINALNLPDVTSEVVLAPRKTFSPGLLFSPFKQRLWRSLIEGADILVVIKGSVFPGFYDVCSDFRSLCHSRNVVLVSSPADGPGSKIGDTRDRFSEEIADYVLPASRAQRDYLNSHRDSSTVFDVGVATRPRQDVCITIRDQVQTVVWENPPHHDPDFNPNTVALSWEQYDAFEKAIRAFCEQRGASLLTFGFWRDHQSDEDWQELMLTADVAIECKAFDRGHTDYQQRKPPTKLQNYLALGLPVICDSVPSYVALGQEAKVLFADNMDDWVSHLTRLFESRDLRAEMSAAARASAAPYSIANVSQNHVASFQKMLANQTSAQRHPAGNNAATA